MPDIVADGDNLGDHIATKSFKQIKGSDVASGDAVTLGFGGNTFDITGTTTINHINNTNWVVGSVVILHFDGAVILTHNAGGLSGNEANILLSGDHKKIAEWRRKQSLLLTLNNRSDLLESADLSKEEITWLREIDVKERD